MNVGIFSKMSFPVCEKMRQKCRNLDVARTSLSWT